MIALTALKTLAIRVDNQHIPRVLVGTLGVATRIPERPGPLEEEAAA